MLGHGLKAAEDRDPFARRNRGTFKKFGIKSVNIPFIAYTVVLVSGEVLCVGLSLICCQTRYALTAETQLSIHAGGADQSYAALYDRIVKTLRQMTPKRLKELTDVWNK